MESFLSNRPDAISRCTFTLNGDQTKCPHHFNSRQKSSRQKIYNNILELIGDTPLVRINRLTNDEDVKCNILAKLEYFNPGGSIKDRIGLRMIEEAERNGNLKPGDTIIESTAGNTGVGLALVCAIKNYRCITVMPEKMSQEKVNILRALNAEIVRTPTGALFDSLESDIGVAHKLKTEIPNSHILDQYRNSYNPIAHYDTTAEEIIQACNGQIDMIVAGAGTGGTLTGLSRKFKEKFPNCIIIGVDTEGSILALPETMNTIGIQFYEVEGIGHDFLPTVLDRSLIDRWYKISDINSFNYARKLMKYEGILCGGSSGAAMACALQACKDFNLNENQNCVVILPDSVRNYMSKFLNDDWMIDRDFINIEEKSIDEWWHTKTVLNLSIHQSITVTENTTIHFVIDLMNKKSFDQIPVIFDDQIIIGVITMNEIMTQISNGTINTKDFVSKIMTKKFQMVQFDDTLLKLSRILKVHNYAIIRIPSEYNSNESTKQRFGIITNIDLLNFIIKQNQTTE